MGHPLEHDLAFVLRSAVERVEQIADPVLKTVNLSARQYWTLSLLGEGSVRQSELLSVLHMNPNIVVNETNALEDRRLIRKRRNPENRREQIIEIEEKGLKVLSRTRAELDRVYGDSLKFPHGEKTLLLRLLSKMGTKNLNADEIAS